MLVLSSRFVFVSALVCVFGVRVCFVVYLCARFCFRLSFSVTSVEATFQKYFSKEPLGIAARNHHSKSQVYVALGSVTLHSALPSYVHGYAPPNPTYLHPSQIVIEPAILGLYNIRIRFCLFMFFPVTMQTNLGLT